MVATKLRTQGMIDINFATCLFSSGLLLVYFNLFRILKHQVEETEFTWVPKKEGKSLTVTMWFLSLCNKLTNDPFNNTISR